MKAICYLLFAICFFAPAHTFALSDIASYPHKSAIDLLHARGIIDGYSDGTFRPNTAINRAEFLKLLMLSVFGDQEFTSVQTRCFADFIGEEQWFWRHACTAKTLGIIHGHPDGTFRGEDTILLAEALKMSFEAWGAPLPAAHPSQPWYQRYMDAAAVRGMFKRFPPTPDYLLTRGEMALLLVMIDEPIAVLNPNAEPRGDLPVFVPISPEQSTCGNGIREGAEQCDDGNTENDDGCSDICILVSQPLHHGTLRIEQQPVSRTDQASGSKDVPLFAFSAIAGRQDVYITTLKFRSAVGSLQFAENYRLLIDRDSDGTVDTLYGRTTPDGETITFGGLNILVKDGNYLDVELWADIDTTLSAGTIAVEFDTTQPDFVEGVDKVDGEDVTGIHLNDEKCTLETICWIRVITQTAQSVTIRTQGNLYVSKSATPLSSRQLLASTQTSELLVLNFYADSEDIEVEQLAIEGVPSTVDYLTVHVEGSSSPFATARSIHCGSVISGRFCTDEEFIVPQNGTKIIVIKAVLKSDEFGGVSGQQLTLSVSAITSGTVAVEAQGYYSGQQLLQNDNSSTAEGEIFIGTESATPNSTITGPVHTITLARIDNIENTNTDSDNSPITAGQFTFADFTFRAADHGNTSGGPNNAVVDKLTFTVSAVNMEFMPGSFYLHNYLDSSVSVACNESAVTGTITVTCSGLDASSVSTVMQRGDSVRLVLHGVVSNAQVSPGVSILQASLNNLSNPGITGTVEWNDEQTTFGWVDIGKSTVKSTSYRLD